MMGAKILLIQTGIRWECIRELWFLQPEETTGLRPVRCSWVTSSVVRRLISSATQLFDGMPHRDNNKDTIKALHHGPSARNRPTSPYVKGQWFPYHDILGSASFLTSLCRLSMESVRRHSTFYPGVATYFCQSLPVFGDSARLLQ